MTDYAIGDIQGCYAELNELLTAISFSPGNDTLWLAGDLVNRGPDSLAVLELLHSLGNSVKLVLGNHDLHFLAVCAGARAASKKDTLKALLRSDKLQALAHWLQAQPLAVTIPQHNMVMVHAGIPPIWSLSKTLLLAEEVHRCLQSKQALRFLQTMYGNTPATWSKKSGGMKRLRLITNYLTRMRFCTASGELDLEEKNARISSRPGFKPWFDHHNPALAKNCEILFGHWAALEGQSYSPRHHALDTGCVWGGSLTAMRLDTRQRTQVAAMGTA